MLLAAAALAVLAYGLMSPMLGAVLPSYHLTAEQNGYLAMVNAFGLVIASLASGPAIDKQGSKPALPAGLFLISVSLYVAPNAGGYSGLLAVYFVLALGGGMVSTGANSLVGAIEPTRRGPALNFLNLFFGVGGVATTYVASHLLKPVALCYAIAFLTVLALIVNAATRMPRPSGNSGFDFKNVPKLVGSPALTLLSLILFLYVSCEVGVWNWLNSYLQQSRGFDAQHAAA